MINERPKMTHERFKQMSHEEQQELIEQELQRRESLNREPEVHVVNPRPGPYVREAQPVVHKQSAQQQQQQQRQEQTVAETWEALKEFRPRIKRRKNKEQGR